MYWNRKMRSICRATDRHVIKILQAGGRQTMREMQWLSAQLYARAGAPPNCLGDACEFAGDARYCAGCWRKVAEDAVDKEDA
jgi:hypothetical protein